MKKRFKYPFTTAGVAQWQTMLSGLSPVQREEVAIRVEQQGLQAFLPWQFILDAQQVAYLDSLPPALCALWATQIAYAIREEIAITLVKPETQGDAHVRGVKFIEANSRTGGMPMLAAAAEEAGESGDFLVFTITY